MNATQEASQVNTWLDLASWDNVGNVLALLVIAFFVLGFMRAVKHAEGVDLLDMFKPLGSSKMRLNGAWVVTSFAFIYLTINKNLTEWYAAAYMAAFVADRAYSRKDGKTEEKKDV